MRRTKGEGLWPRVENKAEQAKMATDEQVQAVPHSFAMKEQATKRKPLRGSDKKALIADFKPQTLSVQGGKVRVWVRM